MAWQRTSKLLLAALLVLACTTTDPLLVGPVVGVVDGDTVDLLDSTKTEHRIRLHGIDCPERGQPFGKAAKLFVSELVYRDTVTVTVVDTDRWGRLVGTVHLGDTSTLAAELVKAGLAWHYRKYSDSQLLDSLQLLAQQNRAGLWADPNRIAPWDWRRGQR